MYHTPVAVVELRILMCSLVPVALAVVAPVGEIQPELMELTTLVVVVVVEDTVVAGVMLEVLAALVL
jgi:hypothetical protein